MEEAARADRVIVINDGEMVMDGTPEDIFSRVEQLHGLGLEAPQGQELLHSLRMCGFDVEGLGISEENCTDILEAFIKNFKKD